MTLPPDPTPPAKRPHQSRTLQVAAGFIALGAFLPQLMPVVDIVAGLHSVSADAVTAIRASLVASGIIFGQLRLITSSAVDLSRKGTDQ